MVVGCEEARRVREGTCERNEKKQQQLIELEKGLTTGWRGGWGPENWIGQKETRELAPWFCRNDHCRSEHTGAMIQ